jgi:hypothetical protein
MTSVIFLMSMIGCKCDLEISCRYLNVVKVRQVLMVSILHIISIIANASVLLWYQTCHRVGSGVERGSVRFLNSYPHVLHLIHLCLARLARLHHGLCRRNTFGEIYSRCASNPSQHSPRGTRVPHFPIRMSGKVPQGILGDLAHQWQDQKDTNGFAESAAESHLHSHCAKRRACTGEWIEWWVESSTWEDSLLQCQV